MSLYLKNLISCLCLLILALAVIHYTNFDIEFQSLFYNKLDNSWLIDRNNFHLKFIFYKLPKALIICYGISIVFYWIKLKLDNRLLSKLAFDREFEGGSERAKAVYIDVHEDSSTEPTYKLPTEVEFRKKSNQNIELQNKLLFLILCLILTPVTVAILKHYSPIHCPSNVVDFGGGAIHVSPLDIFKEGVFFGNTGKCFPAGHASGGFALISLYFVMPSKKLSIFALLGSLSLGTIMGLYQISKGVHYLSDTLATLAIAYIVSITFKKLLLENW